MQAPLPPRCHFRAWFGRGSCLVCLLSPHGNRLRRPCSVMPRSCPYQAVPCAPRIHESIRGSPHAGVAGSPFQAGGMLGLSSNLPQNPPRAEGF
jgi:hypothetical protein